MGIFYLAALIVGFGTIALQLLMGGSGDGDTEAGGGGDADADTEAELDHGDVSHDGEGAHVHADGGFLPIFLSLRFWTFSLLAFGLSGSLLHFLDWASSITALIVAVSLGLLSGFGVSWVFRALGRAQTTSGGTARDAVGQVGKVLVPCTKGGRGKVRIELRGQTVDFMVTTDEEALAAGDLVLVEDVDTAGGNTSGVLQVSRAPAEYFPPGSRPRTRVP
ncbi:MAG: hypothetical protein AB7K71_10655 [Polyangiaceae bacterium]